MLQVLQTLIALQALDTAAEAARRRVAELPTAEREIDAQLTRAAEALEAAKARRQDNQHARRDLEKDVAAVDGRLARFDEHKAAVKTNQEYTALLHEIAGAKAEKDAFEERILMRLEEADAIEADVAAAERALAEAKRAGDAARQALGVERTTLDAALVRLADERRREAAVVDPALLAKYDQLLKQRRTLAVVPVSGDTCTACHVRLRPAVALHVRRNEEIIQCDTCQRILYFPPQAAAPAAAGTRA